MKKSMCGLVATAMLITSFSCGKKHETSRQDIDFLFDTIEHVWLVTVEYTRKGQADQGLDICEKFVNERGDRLAEAGKGLSDAMFNDGVRLHYAERSQKYRAVTDKYEDYLTRNLSAPQMERFNVITAEKIGKKYMDNIKWETDPVKFFKKAIQQNL